MFTKVFIQIFIVLFICIYKVKSQVNRTCLTPNGETTKCISIYDCKVFLDVIKTEDETQKKYMKDSLCGHVRGVPIVCCGSHSNYLTPPKRTKRAAEFKKNSAIPETDCGKPAENKLTGQVANDRDFPWAVRIKYSNQSKYSCEGTLINKRYVITAGLCISEKTLKRIGPISSIRLGLHNCPNKEDCEKELLDVGVDEVILHKDYGEIKSTNHDDIGLIRLNQDVTFNSAISPICLQNPNESAKSGDQVVEIGWHRDSPVKLQAPITVVDKEQCTNTYKNHKIELTDTHLCAAEYPNKNCAGTSGGALMKFRNGDHPAWTLEGIVSFGPVVCGGSDFPTVFTKVEPYLQWIHDNVKN